MISTPQRVILAIVRGLYAQTSIVSNSGARHEVRSGFGRQRVFPIGNQNVGGALERGNDQQSGGAKGRGQHEHRVEGAGYVDNQTSKERGHGVSGERYTLSLHDALPI